MSYATKHQYAGGDPFEAEEERLLYLIFEALSQDEQYIKLAQVRWLVTECEMEMSGDTVISDETSQLLLKAGKLTLQQAVDNYVTGWIASQTESWLDEWDIDEEIVADACEEYDVVVEGVSD